MVLAAVCTTAKHHSELALKSEVKLGTSLPSVQLNSSESKPKSLVCYPQPTKRGHFLKIQPNPKTHRYWIKDVLSFTIFSESIAGELKNPFLQQPSTNVSYFTEDDFVSFNKIASGGFTKVFKAKHKLWRVNLAVKCCHLLCEESSSFERNMSHLVEEAAKMLKINFKYILPIYGICTRPAGIVMEYMENGSLDKLLVRYTLTWPMKFRIIHEIAVGMNFLHSVNPPLLHLNLKPGNVLVDENLHIKISDFGLSKWEDYLSSMEQIERSVVRGTIRYMPPELLNRPSGVKHDVYSFSIVMWEILTQQKSYAGENIMAVFVKVAAGERPCLQLIPENSPQECTQIIDLMKRCWDQELKRRPAFSEIVVETEMLYSLLQFPDIQMNKQTEKSKLAPQSSSSSLHNEAIIAEIASIELQKLNLLSETGSNDELSVDCRKELLQLLLEKDIGNLKRILRKEHVTLNFVEDYTLLHLAVLTGDVEFVKLVLRYGGSVNAQTSRGLTPLIVAVQNRFVDLCMLLIEEGADVNLTDEGNWAPLHFASQNGDDRISRLLLDKDAHVNIKEHDGWSPLHLASQNGHENVIRVLFTRQANLDLQESDNRTSLHLAAYHGHYNIAKLLIGQGADLNKTQVGLRTPLHLAAERGFFRVARLLVNSGADVDCLDHSHSTPLHLSALNGHTGISRHLLKHGANINEKTLQNWTPLHLASQKGQLTTVHLLIESFSDLDVTGDMEWTPLHLATCYNHEEVVSELLVSGANPNKTDESGWTPLHLAAHKGRLHILVKLLDHKANVNAANKFGWTSLHLAALNGNAAIVKTLIRHNADLKAEDTYQNTPLQLAMKHRKQSVVSVLTGQCPLQVMDIKPGKLQNINLYHQILARTPSFETLHRTVNLVFLTDDVPI
ncbi:ankyrin repeat and protein kinase domain-containing protein 1 [Heterodontus francisci]|uniref:ankyrin repeat and protein kinase domain-containing protein 1 n=1 Tax=Heterodontus francisci TaxID=7792 RepID=UPI00355BF6C8